VAVRGWITLSRKIQDHWLWQKNKPFDYRSAWIDLLLTVNHEDKKIPFGGQVIMVKRGSTVFLEKCFWAVKIMNAGGCTMLDPHPSFESAMEWIRKNLLELTNGK
jgi:hypothetical protein